LDEGDGLAKDEGDVRFGLDLETFFQRGEIFGLLALSMTSRTVFITRRRAEV
jgi:hypothetical protein